MELGKVSFTQSMVFDGTVKENIGLSVGYNSPGDRSSLYEYTKF